MNYFKLLYECLTTDKHDTTEAPGFVGYFIIPALFLVVILVILYIGYLGLSSTLEN